MPVHKRKANITTGLPVSVKNSRKRLKITGTVFTVEKKGGARGEE
jgi:hypothetical protein